MQLLTAKFAQIASEIDSTSVQITALQAKLSELQEHQQQLLSVEQACQSALCQVDTALMMLHHVDPAEIATFKDALVVKFSNEVIALIEPADTKVADPTPAEPTAPTPPDDNPVIDIESTPATETPATDTPATETPATDTPDTATDIEKTLKNLSLQSFRKLAKSKGLDSRLNRTVLTAKLKKLITRDEVLALS